MIVFWIFNLPEQYIVRLEDTESSINRPRGQNYWTISHHQQEYLKTDELTFITRIFCSLFMASSNFTKSNKQSHHLLIVNKEFLRDIQFKMQDDNYKATLSLISECQYVFRSLGSHFILKKQSDKFRCGPAKKRC